MSRWIAAGALAVLSAVSAAYAALLMGAAEAGRFSGEDIEPSALGWPYQAYMMHLEETAVTKGGAAAVIAAILLCSAAIIATRK